MSARKSGLSRLVFDKTTKKIVSRGPAGAIIDRARVSPLCPHCAVGLGTLLSPQSGERWYICDECGWNDYEEQHKTYLRILAPVETLYEAAQRIATMAGDFEAKKAAARDYLELRPKINPYDLYRAINAELGRS